MGKRLRNWEIGGFLWTVLAGTALHFLYDWTGGAVWAATVSAVNESVWEHMKLLFVPVFLFTLVQQAVLGRQYPNLPAVRAVSLLAALVFLPAAYYAYTGALGVHALWADILLFVLAAALLFRLDCRLLRRGAFSAGWQQAAGLLALWALVFVFLWCTFRPPHLPLWQDPSAGGCGLSLDPPAKARYNHGNV